MRQLFLIAGIEVIWSSWFECIKLHNFLFFYYCCSIFITLLLLFVFLLFQQDFLPPNQKQTIHLSSWVTASLGTDAHLSQVFQYLYILQDCHDILPPEMMPVTLMKGTAAFELSNTGCSSLSLLLCHQPPAPRCSHAPVILPTACLTHRGLF